MADAVSHDQNFKNLILDYPRDALVFFAPEEAPGPEDEVRILPVRQEQLQERLGQRYRELDTPLLVEWSGDRREAVVFALEEESDARRFSPHRLARYCLDLAELLETDRVVPVTIFLRAGAAPAVLALGTERRRYLTFDHLSCRLAALDASRWLDSANPVALVNLPNMRGPADMDRVDVYARAVNGMRTLEPDGAKLAKYVEFIDIYAALTDNEFQVYRRRYPEENAIMTGVIQRARDEARDEALRQGRDEGMRAGRDEGMRAGRDEGMRAGRDEGMRAGRVEGERALLERQLRRRFGPLSPAVSDRLHGASATDLEAWAENLLEARTLDDVFGPKP